MQRENWLLSGKDWKKLADCCQDSQSLQAGQASTILLMLAPRPEPLKLPNAWCHVVERGQYTSGLLEPSPCLVNLSSGVVVAGAGVRSMILAGVQVVSVVAGKNQKQWYAKL